MIKNNSNLKALALNNVLSVSAMKLVKGGATSAQNNQGQNTQGQNTQSAQDDDKRRERPGGGITTH